jgi:hypothetical protein
MCPITLQSLAVDSQIFEFHDACGYSRTVQL